MNDLTELLVGTQTSPVSPGSRYYGVGTAVLEAPDGKKVPYLRRRFPPAPESMTTIQTHVISEGDRLDNLAARYLGDPEQYWRLCDANRVLWPDELTEMVGRRLRIAIAQ